MLGATSRHPLDLPHTAAVNPSGHYVAQDAEYSAELILLEGVVASAVLRGPIGYKSAG
jgi:hypothetical protein